MELLVQCLRHQILGMIQAPWDTSKFSFYSPYPFLYQGSSVFSSRCSFLDSNFSMPLPAWEWNRSTRLDLVI
ncbi:hypothetical protein NC653_021582 [Populus alba x Populus x berolinensis]|uniref:Uncharacterized protein n=1 Tax=Populus alba x Populus x berolinensis TaxID=444605 RepID=A0AAD6MQC6_9ROSI|nr:hypothetical protein NC653_021582 [Populus alba x Populus x berolinensis]